MSAPRRRFPLSHAQASILSRMINGAVLRWTPNGYICGDKKVRDRRTIHGLQTLEFIGRGDEPNLFEVTTAGREAYQS